MKIEELNNKVKIIFEYPKKLIDFCTITNEDLKKLHFRVFLNDGTEIYGEGIKQITLSLKEDKTEDKNKNEVKEK